MNGPVFYRTRPADRVLGGCSYCIRSTRNGLHSHDADDRADVQRAMSKLGVQNRAQLVVIAFQPGLVRVEPPRQDGTGHR